MKRNLLIVMHRRRYGDRKGYRIQVQRGQRYRHYNRSKLPKALEILSKDCKANVTFIVGDVYIHYHMEV